MISKEHKKHTALSKPTGGKFHRNEIALIGAPCSVIQALSEKIAMALPDLKIGYVDAAHSSEEEKGSYAWTYTDMISWHRIHTNQTPIEYDLFSYFAPTDLALINGNHFIGQKQIVILDERKKDSLSKKTDRLTDVLCFLTTENNSEIYPFLRENIRNIEAIPILSIKDIYSIAKLIRKEIAGNIPQLKGLVLSGGQSMRMGQDKSQLDYHGKPQVIYMAEMLSEICLDTRISVAQTGTTNSPYPEITDTFLDLGPMGGILSAFREDPNSAWLVVATDLPLLDKNALSFLIQNRDPQKIATCFHNPATNFPEPLITIWEPRAYSRLLHFLSLGYSCPRKVLINNDIHSILPENPEVLTNVNTPEERAQLFEKVRKR